MVRAPNHQRLGDPGYYLLSAAHVLVDIANDMKENGCSLLVSWSQNDGTRHDFVETTHGALILHRDYILKGSHDYGFMELKSLTQETFRTETKTLRLCSPRVGESVVARGRVFLRGTVTGVLEDSPRFSVLAHSIPGSSGAPVFNNERQLAGVVHGSSKHKGHSYGNIAEDAAVAYADIILVTDGLFQICDIHWNWLRKAEFVPPEVASGKTGLSRTETTRQDQVEVQTEGTEALWDLCNEMNMEYNFMSEVTLKMIMEELTKQVVKAENQTTWWEDREFELVVVSDSTQTI